MDLNNFKRLVLTDTASNLFDTLCRSDHAGSFCLVGGTALALQIGHRKSLDFDLAVYDKALPRHTIRQLIADLRSNGHQVVNTTSPSQISTFKINTGLDLEDHIQDFAVDGVKLQFFIHGNSPEQKAAYSKLKEPITESTLSILSLEGIKLAKSLVLSSRVRSRDLYDIAELTSLHGLTIKQMNNWYEVYCPDKSFEAIKNILTGATPLDREDEGLDAVNTDQNIETVYLTLGSAVNRYEVELSSELIRQKIKTNINEQQPLAESMKRLSKKIKSADSANNQPKTPGIP